MITSSGPNCDVYGKFILLEGVNSFSVKGIKDILHCHGACKKLVKKAFAARDWKLLPDGPLRKVFKDNDSPMQAGV